MNRRPLLRIVAPAAASPEEVVAVRPVAERGVRETAPTPAPRPPARSSAWARASMLEATGHADQVRWGR